MLNLLFTLLLSSTPTPAQVLKGADQLEVPAHRLVVIDSEINSRSVDIVLTRLETLEKQNDKEDIYLLITSPGGSVIAGARIAAFMENSKVKVNTICEIYCASMAAVIHQYGYKRYMIGQSLFMLHPAAGSVSGTFPEMQSFLGVLTRYVGNMDNYIIGRSKLDAATYRKLVDNTLWLTSEETVEKGFADSVVKVSIVKDLTKGGPLFLRQELVQTGIEIETNTSDYLDYLKMLESFR